MTRSWSDGDRVFERLVEATARLDGAGREAFLARLVLLLAAEIGDGAVALAAIEDAAL